MNALLQNAAAVLVLPALAMTPLAGFGQSAKNPLAQPLTKEDLKPTYFAIVECARRNKEPGCLAARELADKLLDRPYVTALCKDTAFDVTLQAKTVTTNTFDRKELLVNKANDIMQLCKGKEDPRPIGGSMEGSGIKESNTLLR